MARRAVVLGIEGQSIELARALQRGQWTVVVADTDPDQVARLAAADIDERHIPDTSEVALRELIDDRTDAVVAMLGDDEANAAVLRVARDAGVPRLVARPALPGSNESGDDTDLVVIDPGTAIVALLEQAVTAPQSATLLLRRDSERMVSQVRVANQELEGVAVRDLRLPADVLLLQLTRDGSTVVVAGHTELRRGDEITLLSSADGLAETETRLGA